ncbi:hypothetical protein BK643_30475 [Pseudomonas protegens]|nr:hypothetical protein C1883_30240 [Pseudomonas protegens]ROM13895.1 hypothetical protein BK643_30475 [Pseudomonas protegens]
MPAKGPASLGQTLRPPSRASPLLQNVSIGGAVFNQAEGHAAAVLTKTQHQAASFVMVGLGWKRYSRAISNPTDARHKDAFDD